MARDSTYARRKGPMIIRRRPLTIGVPVMRGYRTACKEAFDSR